MVVLIDTRDPDTADNVGMVMLGGNPDFAAFVAEELVPSIDSAYRTNASADARAFLGTSWGAVTSAYMALNYSDVFHLIGMNSPFLPYHPTLTDDFRQTGRLPLKFFITQGTYDLEIPSILVFRDALEASDNEMMYVEVNDQHCWGQWRGLLDDLLVYFFGKE
jgi:enterochelin esterase-like enzyme